MLDVKEEKMSWGNGISGTSYTWEGENPDGKKYQSNIRIPDNKNHFPCWVKILVEEKVVKHFCCPIQLLLLKWKLWRSGQNPFIHFSVRI